MAQGIPGGQSPTGPQLPDELEMSAETQEPVVALPPLAAPAQPRIFTLEKFIKNGVKYFNSTTEPYKVESMDFEHAKNL